MVSLHYHFHRMIAESWEILRWIHIDGKLANDVEPKDRDIAMVTQNYALYPHMTVGPDNYWHSVLS